VRDRVFDAVVVAQAFQWFETDRALREIARVLRPGGVVGLVWNMRDESVPWVHRLGTIIGSETDPPAPGAALGLSGAFAPIETRRYRFWQRLDRQRLLDLVTSRSYVAALGADEREQILANVSQLYDAYRGDALGLQMPYETLCFRAVRT
jgi:SAM-dependent methyltransferase